MRENPFFKVGGTPAKGGRGDFASFISLPPALIPMLTGRDGFSAQPAIRRARLEGTGKTSKPHSFSSCASMATTITAHKDQGGFKSTSQVPK